MSFVRGAVLLIVLAAAALGQAAFQNFESPLVHPVRLSPDGSRLFAVDPADNRLLVWSLANPANPTLLAEIPVGLEPVSVFPRTNDEVWVANHLSDSVSVVSVSAGRVVETLKIKDEPSDILIVGGRVFVSAAASDQVWVLDLASRSLIGLVNIFGKDPRALAVNSTGTKLYVAVHRSGNGTTVIPANDAPLPPAPTNASLPAAPRTGLIVAANDPAYASLINYTLPDNDVAEIDVGSLAITRYFPRVGTTNTDLLVHPQSNELWVANTDARNLVRFEPVLNGHAIDSRVTRITTGASPTTTPFDLNPGVNYSILVNPAAKALALAEPTGLALDAQAGRLFVAAQGTDRIGVLDLAGNVVDRIEVGVTPGAQVNTVQKRGPRGLAFRAASNHLYVYQKLHRSVAVIDVPTRSVLKELALGLQDPTPASIRDGRKFLYDAKLSGNGTMSCASCHVDGDLDGLAWDLGDPGGSLQAAPTQPFPFSIGLTSFHPMKGPMTTQTLKGLSGVGPLHWRGDRANFQAFNGAFASLLGGSTISAADMNLFAAFGTAIAFPPNPSQLYDRQYLTAPAGANQQAGFVAFQQAIATIPLIGTASCTTCHTLPRGTNGNVVTASILQESQQQKVPQLRNLYRKNGFIRSPGPQKSGFGFIHDGSVDTLTAFLGLPVFNPWPNNLKDDLVQFLLAFDTGTAPTVGFQTTLAAATAGLPSIASELALLTARAAAGDIDLVARGFLLSEPRGLLYSPSTQTFSTDRSGVGPYTLSALVALAAGGDATLTFTGTPPGSGTRIAIDRDLDGILDGHEGVERYGSGTPGVAGVPWIGTNSDPRIGNAGFAIVASNAPPNAAGAFVLGFAPSSLPLAGITVLVDLGFGPPLLLPTNADADGWSTFPVALPSDPALVGASVYAQYAWVDPAAAAGLSATRGLRITF